MLATHHSEETALFGRYRLAAYDEMFERRGASPAALRAALRPARQARARRSWSAATGWPT